MLFRSILVGIAIGLALPLLELAFPRQRKYLPSAMGVGLAMVIPGFNSISMFLGAVVAAMYARAKPKDAELFTVPVASGIIAGESILGVLIILLGAVGLFQ